MELYILNDDFEIIKYLNDYISLSGYVDILMLEILC